MNRQTGVVMLADGLTTAECFGPAVARHVRQEVPLREGVLCSIRSGIRQICATQFISRPLPSDQISMFFGGLE